MAKKTTKGRGAAEVIAGIAAIGTAAVGYYFYGSKQAKQHRGAAVKWAADMKKEVMREAKKAKEINAKDFAKIVDMITKTYADIRTVDTKDVKRAASELKANWEVVVREAQKAGRKSVAVTKVAKKSAVASGKKIVKKVVANAKKTVRKSR
jgi:hypothetical protein